MKTHSKLQLFIALALLNIPCASMAAENSAETASAGDASELVSDVYGGKEAPLDMNIMPWQRTTAKLTKPEITSSILDRIMKPIDRTSLKRELDFIENRSE